MALDPKLRSPKEEPLFLIGAIFSGFIWLMLTVGTLGIGVIYGALVAFGVWVAHSLYLAHVRGNGLLISAAQLPDLHARCQAAAEKLGMKQLPDIYVQQADGILNAFATKLLSRKYVIINSALLGECSDTRQVDFVVGHELAHHAAGHLAWNAFLAPFRIVPWLGPAYSRACEYTCDRAGFHVVGELEPSLRALVVLAAGGKHAGEVNLPAFMAQREGAGGFWMATLELVSTHPFLCKRAAALEEFAKPGTVKAVSRTPWAYPFAPFLGISAGAPSSVMLLVVAYLGIVAAIAIPAFAKYQQKAREAAMPPPPAAYDDGAFGDGSEGFPEEEAPGGPLDEAPPEGAEQEDSEGVPPDPRLPKGEKL